eukprot:Clim_evm2s97 gene=Clim_evmTU2s97
MDTSNFSHAQFRKLLGEYGIEVKGPVNQLTRPKWERELNNLINKQKAEKTPKGSPRRTPKSTPSRKTTSRGKGAAGSAVATAEEGGSLISLPLILVVVLAAVGAAYLFTQSSNSGLTRL